MADFFKDLKRRYFNGNMLYRLLFINVAVFAAATLLNVLAFLFGINAYFIFQYLELPSSFGLFLFRPWTIITYMFLHTNFLHILFNMLWLYWFGQMFTRRFTERQLLGVYILGGITGGVLYMISYNVFPAFEAVKYSSYLLGASASVLAIVVATAVRMPDDQVFLMFLGAVKLKYIAIFVVALSFINTTSDNAGGNLAHLGGALFGYIFASSYKKGTDITRFFSRISDSIVNLFRSSSKPKMNVRMGDKQKDMEYNRKKKATQEEIDAILDKMKKTGYDGLSEDEKRKLFSAGK